MEFSEMQEQARAVRSRYAEAETSRWGRPWSGEEILLGFLGDVGDLAKLVQAREGVRDLGSAGEVDDALAHELADCLWAVMVLADAYEVDLARAFTTTMTGITERLAQGPL